VRIPRKSCSHLTREMRAAKDVTFDTSVRCQTELPSNHIRKRVGPGISEVTSDRSFHCATLKVQSIIPPIKPCTCMFQMYIIDSDYKVLLSKYSQLKKRHCMHYSSFCPVKIKVLGLNALLYYNALILNARWPNNTIRSLYPIELYKRQG
jgi:hypothetical protein